LTLAFLQFEIHLKDYITTKQNKPKISMSDYLN